MRCRADSNHRGSCCNPARPPSSTITTASSHRKPAREKRPSRHPHPLRDSSTRATESPERRRGTPRSFTRRHVPVCKVSVWTCSLDGVDGFVGGRSSMPVRRVFCAEGSPRRCVHARHEQAGLPCPSRYRAGPTGRAGPPFLEHRPDSAVGPEPGAVMGAVGLTDRLVLLACWSSGPFEAPDTKDPAPRRYELAGPLLWGG